MYDFWKATSIRALRTICQTATAIITASIAGNAFGVLSDVNWQMVASASALAGILSVLTSIATGLPEVEYQRHIHMDMEEPLDSFIVEEGEDDGEE